ncbi:gamma carbonic anhydrase family protein [Ferroplasma sp.]|uniref:gamma carbonic anhydrase family protein n=1 Tax=Ferroplasma sp. TaxID=2591003 RepID=UPI00307EA847
MIYEFEGRVPAISKSAYVFESATIIGNVHIGDNVWIGPGAVLRGDYGEISVGSYSAIEDNCVIHARPGEKTSIGEHVTVGHLSVIHTGTIKDYAVIGMNSTVSDFATVGKWAAIGEGAVVKNGSVIPDKGIAVGVPAKVIGEVSIEYINVWTKYKENYNTFCKRYLENLKPLKN